MEAEIGLMLSQAKECWHPPEPGKGQEEVLPSSPEGSAALVYLDFDPVMLILDFRDPELWQNKFLLFLVTHHVCGNLLQKSWEICMFTKWPSEYSLVDQIRSNVCGKCWLCWLKLSVSHGRWNRCKLVNWHYSLYVLVFTCLVSLTNISLTEKYQ